MEGRIKAGCTVELLRRHTHITDTLVVCAKAQASPRPSLGGTRSNREYTHRYQGISSLAMSRDYGVSEITIWFSTSLTPGAAQAASSAAFFSA